MKTINTNPLLNRDSYLDEAAFRREEKQIEKEIFYYKLTYCAIAVYCSMSKLLSVPVYIELSKIYETRKGLFLIFLVGGLTALVKPLFGWIGDWFFPFGYRVKTYCIACCLINLILMIFLHYSTSYWSLFVLSMLLELNMNCLDAIAQGMTSITIEMELRLLAKKHPFAEEIRDKNSVEINLHTKTLGFFISEMDRVWEPSYSRNFAHYCIVLTGAKFFWVTIRDLARQACVDQTHESLQMTKDTSPINISIVKYIVTLTSLALIIIMFFFKEKRMSYVIYPDHHKGKHLLDSVKFLLGKRKWVLILISFFLCAHPLLQMTYICSNYLVKIIVENGLWRYTEQTTTPVAGILCVMLMVLSADYKSKNQKPITYLMSILFWMGLLCIALIVLVMTHHFECLNKIIIIYGSTIAIYSIPNLIYGISLIWIVGNFVKKVPIGHEFFCITLLTGLVSLGYHSGFLIHIILIPPESYETDHFGVDQIFWYFVVIFGLIPIGLYFAMYNGLNGDEEYHSDSRKLMLERERSKHQNDYSDVERINNFASFSPQSED